MAVPTLADAKARIDHHRRELEKVLRDRYGVDVMALATCTCRSLKRLGSIRAKVVRITSRPILVFQGYGGWID
ncbi:hypothetical protein [Nitrobacter hamburgensis]|uniref:hypothetical protein n=1 Tax=Nitrobacter hamburgensis TaxID=912 RepID=UPI00059BA7F2|nr:hypothetical protein [Nitrobacter hamburgensis]